MKPNAYSVYIQVWEAGGYVLAIQTHKVYMPVYFIQRLAGCTMTVYNTGYTSTCTRAHMNTVLRLFSSSAAPAHFSSCPPALSGQGIPCVGEAEGGA